MFSVGGVWPQLPSRLGIQLKVWLVRKHPSRLGMDPVYKELCTLAQVCHS